MDRRRFFKLTAITGTTAALSACGNPENQIVRFIPDEEITPGIAEWRPSICPLCAAGCGVLARVMDGDAEVIRNGTPGVVRMPLVKKLEGDPAHPISQGRLCVRGQAAVQVTYHPDRLVAPMKRSGDRGAGQFTEISWDEALSTLVARLDAARPDGRSSRVAFLGRPRQGRRFALVASFVQQLGAGMPIAFEPFEDRALRRANELAFGRFQLPTFDLSHTRFFLNFGADVLGTWNSPLAHTRAYGAMRQGRAGTRARFVQVEPRLSQTGASADDWIAIRPGTEGAFALGLAHVIMSSGLRTAEAAGHAGSLVDGWSSRLPAFTPAAVETLTGIPAARIERLAREFAGNRPSVAAIGGAPLAQTNGLAQALAVNALNALVGSVGVEGGVTFMPKADTSGWLTETLPRAMANQTPQVLLIDEANPVFGGPPAWKVRDWLATIPFIASFGSFLDDTSVHADLLLPDHSFLEAWTESVPESGASTFVSTSTPPAMRPLYDTRATPDVLLEVSRRVSPPLLLRQETFEELLKTPAAPLPDAAAGTRLREFRDAAPTAWTPPAFDGAAADFPFLFQPYPSQAFLDGSLAHLPWLQELPDPLTTAMWSAWVELNVRTAERLSLADGDMVEVRSAHGSLQAPVVISPGIGPDMVAMPVGQGHGTFTRYASGRGANPLSVLAPVVEPSTGQHAWAATRVAIRKLSDADGSLIRFGGATRERPEHLRGRG